MSDTTEQPADILTPDEPLSVPGAAAEAPVTDPRHDPDYEWPDLGNVASQGDIAAAVAHLKAWVKRLVTPT